MLFKNNISGEIVEAMQYKKGKERECAKFFGEPAETISCNLKSGFESWVAIGAHLIPENAYIIKNSPEPHYLPHTDFETQFTIYKS